MGDQIRIAVTRLEASGPAGPGGVSAPGLAAPERSGAASPGLAGYSGTSFLLEHVEKNQTSNRMSHIV